MDCQLITLDALISHPANSNVMSPALMAKLAAHIRRSGRYPPLIVRPVGAGQYQLLDGHHRAAVLRELGHAHARCVVWDVDDAEAMLLLTTLNRLEGADDPRKRAELVAQLQDLTGQGAQALAKLLPESAEALAHLERLRGPMTVRPAAAADELPVALHFFVTPACKRAIESKLATTGLGREAALCRLLQLEDCHD